MRTLPHPPAEFTTDGCSGLMSALWRRLMKSPPPWEGACLAHDWFYFHGGPLRLRLEADARLMSDVALKGHPWWALIMFVAVRIGGVWWLPYKSARWGYGWPYPHYGPTDSDFVTPPFDETKAHKQVDELENA